MRLQGGREATDQDWADLISKTARVGFYGVASTGIYCDFGCPSRPPLRKNLRIFDGLAEVAAAGFRRCKRCALRAAK